MKTKSNQRHSGRIVTVDGQIMVIGGIHTGYRHIFNKYSLITYRPVNKLTVVQ